MNCPECGADIGTASRCVACGEDLGFGLLDAVVVVAAIALLASVACFGAYAAVLAHWSVWR